VTDDYCMMTVMPSGYTAGSGMWRLSLPPIPTTPQFSQPSAPRSSYSEKRVSLAAPAGRASTCQAPIAGPQHLDGTDAPRDDSNRDFNNGDERPYSNERHERPRRTSRDGIEEHNLPKTGLRDPFDSNEPQEHTELNSVTSLQQRVGSLQAQLDLEQSQKHRGSKRFMGGGQFKSGTPNGRNRQCPVCFNLRETIHKMRTDQTELEQQNTHLRHQLAQQQSMWEEASSGSTSTMRHRIAELEAARDSLTVTLEDERQRSRVGELQLKSQLEVEAKHSAQLQSQVGQMMLEKEAAAAAEAATANQLAALKSELAHARDRINKLEQQVNTSHVELRVVTEEMNHHKASNIRNEGQVKTLTIEVEHLKNQLAEGGTVQENTVSLLQQQLQDLREQVTRIRTETETVTNERNVYITKLSDAEHRLQQHSAELEDRSHEIATLKARVDALTASNLELQRVSAELLQQVSELDRLRAETGEIDQMKALIATLEAEVRALNAKLSAAAMSSEEAKVKLQDQAIKLTHLEADNAKIRGEAKAAKAQAETDASECARLKAELERLKEQLERLKAELAKMRALKDAAELAREAAEERARNAEKEARMENTKLVMSLASAEKAASVAEDEAATLRKDKSKKEQTILDLIQKNRDDIEKVKKEALEKTMQSMVRLCVVAPTVNVSFGTEQLTCKAGLPGDRIHTIIEKQILPGFIQLFLQPEEGIGPEGSELSQWVEKLMADMQGSIERHLSGVFS